MSKKIQVDDQIFESPNAAIFRGSYNGQPAIFKQLKKNQDFARAHAQFKQEYLTTTSIDSPCIVKALAFEDLNGAPCIVLADNGGQQLGDQLKQRSDVSISDKIWIAVEVAKALEAINEAKIIHKDINPSNIVVNFDDKNVNLIDFGIAASIAREHQGESEISRIEGTLEYMSPEQSGRLNRSIDYRTDFFSLGITLYELMSGSNPFKGVDTPETVYKLIVHSPDRLHDINSQIPKAFSEIVACLLAKDPANRYSSARGIRLDLERVAELHAKGEANIDFAIREHDFSDRFEIPDKLYGREKETDLLIEKFEQVRTGESPIILISGPSGIGKSALVKQLRKPMVERGGIFTQGKFGQYQRNVPYSAIVEAVSVLIKQLLAGDPNHADRVKESFLAKAKNKAGALTEFCPEVEKLIGPQEKPEELDIAQSRLRLKEALRDFLQCTANKDCPIVFFIDDLQWADNASLGMLDLFAGKNAAKFLFFVGTYRDNEVSPSHPLMVRLSELTKAGSVVEDIVANNLAIENINELARDTLKREDQDTKELVEIIHTKTYGNPFFIQTFLTFLYKEGIICYSFDNNKWDWNIADVQAAQITENVVELLLRQFFKLGEKTRKALMFASCIGAKFDLRTLSILMNEDQRQVAKSLWIAVKDGYILPQSTDYRLFQSADDDVTSDVEEEHIPELSCRFAHDRIQQAAHELIDDREKSATHYNMGMLLVKSLSDTERDQRAFEIADHLNFGLALLESDKERILVMEVNTKAGELAQASGAFDSATAYYGKAQELGKESDWEAHLDVMKTIYDGASRCYNVLGEFERSQVLRKKLLDKLTDPIEKAKSYEVLAKNYEGREMFQECITTSLTGLRLLDIHVDPFLTEEEFYSKLFEAKYVFTEDLITWIEKGYEEGPQTVSPAWQAIFTLVAETHNSAYMNKPYLLCYLGITVVQKAFSEKAYPADPYFLLNVSLLLFAVKNAQSAKRVKAVANKIIQNYIDTRLETRYLLTAGLYTEVANKTFEECRQLEQRAYESALKTGDISSAGIALFCMHSVMFYGGFVLDEIISSYDRFDSFFDEQPNFWFVALYLGPRQLAMALAGRTENSASFSDSRISEKDLYELCLKSPTSLVIYKISRSINDFLNQDYEGVVNWSYYNFIEIDLPGSPWGLLHYACLGVSLSRLLREKKYPHPKEDMELKLKACFQAARFWRKNYTHFGAGFCTLIEAEALYYDGDSVKALNLYEKAAEEFEGSKNFLWIGITLEAMAGVYHDLGLKKQAADKLEATLDAYKTYGGKSLIERTINRFGEYGLTISTLVHTSSNATIQGTTSYTMSEVSASVDFAAVVKGSQSIAGEIDLNQLVIRVLSIIMENAGADAGALITLEDDNLICSVSGHLSEGNFHGDSTSPSEENSHRFPKRLIDYVFRASEEIVINENLTESDFHKDEYFAKQGPKSVICAPVLNQSKIIAILYLENSSMENAFTLDRLEVLRILAAQGAISLANATFIRDLQESSDRISGLKGQLEKILAGTKKMASSSTPENALQHASECLRDEIGGMRETHCGVYLLASETAPEAYFTQGENGELVSSSLPDTVINTVFDDTTRAHMTDYGALVLPIRWLNKTSGAFIFEGYNQSLPQEDELGFVETLFQSLGLALQNISYQIHLEKLVEQRTQALQQALDVVTEKKQKIDSIMENIDQGILTFGEGLEIDEDYSAQLPSIVGRDGSEAGGEKLMEFVFDAIELSSDIKNQIKQSLDVVVGEDQLNWELNSDKLPLEVTGEMKGKRKILGMDWNPILNDQDTVVRMMLTIRDLTVQRKLEQEAANASVVQARKMNALGMMLSVERSQMRGFFKDANQRLDHIRSLINGTSNFEVIFHDLHTLKGSSSTLGLTDISPLVHDTEDLLPVGRGAGKDFDEAEFKKRLESLDKEVSYHFEVFNEVFGSDDTGETWNLHVGLKVFHKRVEKVVKENEIAFGGFTIRDSVGFWTEDLQKILSAILPHCVNNSIDHGYVLPLQSGKSVKSFDMEVTAHRENHMVHLEIADRGAGLNHTKLKELAEKKGIPEADYMEVLYADGASTSNVVTMTSGRGVGLGAVRQLAKEQGGNVELVDREGGGTVCIIRLRNEVKEELDRAS